MSPKQTFTLSPPQLHFQLKHPPLLLPHPHDVLVWLGSRPCGRRRRRRRWPRGVGGEREPGRRLRPWGQGSNSELVPCHLERPGDHY